MVGRRTAKDTAKLIDEVARGDRFLEDIKDPQLRETVRLALRLHKDPYSGPDAKTRSRIRSRVFRTLRPGPASLADRIVISFEILAKPAPYAMRAFAIALIVAFIGASTALVSAGTAAAALSVLATTNVPSQDLSPAAAIAAQAADTADRAATVAEQKVTPRSSATPQATRAPERTTGAQGTVSARTQAQPATETRRAESARETNTPKNERAAESARKAADEAKAAAQKAKEGKKKTPSPTPPRR